MLETIEWLKSNTKELPLMTQKERMFFRLVCEECINNKHITEEWVNKYANAYYWTYNELLEYLDKWNRNGIYDYIDKIANGHLLIEKIRGEYRMLYNEVLGVLT